MTGEMELTPRSENFSAWYDEIVLQAELAAPTPVHGCPVIRPYGYGIWELLQDALDGMLKATGHENAYFPLLIPRSQLERAAEQIGGVATEAALVTRAGDQELDDPLAVRPTSEPIIWPILADWIQSQRDLPLLINQWANAVRWESRPRPFLRTVEFLWQEGHTAHAGEAEADEQARRVLGIYRKLMEDWMAMPPVTGRKTERQKFPGALRTYSCEALMQDNRALQVGTSHHLGQTFARAFDVQYRTEEGERVYVWNTSCSVSTRLLGGLVMTHGDDRGLVLPPRLAPVQVVIVPIWESDRQRTLMLEVAGRVKAVLQRELRVKVDDRDSVEPDAKFGEWERKGVPMRLEIGPDDVSRQRVTIVRRFAGQENRTRTSRPEGEALATLPRVLNGMQRELYTRALRRREERTYRHISELERMRERVESGGGFFYAGWCESEDCAERVEEETSVTIRVIPDEPFRSEEAPEHCVACDGEAQTEAVWARAFDEG